MREIKFRAWVHGGIDEWLKNRIGDITRGYFEENRDKSLRRLEIMRMWAARLLEKGDTETSPAAQYQEVQGVV